MVKTILAMVLIIMALLAGCIGETGNTKLKTIIDQQDDQVISKTNKVWPANQTFNYSDQTLLQDQLKITSPAFAHGADIQKKYSCDGDDINPPLKIENAPNGTVSFALIVDDPDAPSGTFVHWVVWDIPPETKEIAEATVPKGAIEGTNDFGEIGYGGPCPPSGPSHTYRFTLYAVNQMLGLQQGATRFELDSALEGAVIDYAELDGEYKR